LFRSWDKEANNNPLELRSEEVICPVINLELVTILILIISLLDKSKFWVAVWLPKLSWFAIAPAKEADVKMPLPPLKINCLP
jgi:hypothetical protein